MSDLDNAAAGKSRSSPIGLRRVVVGITGASGAVYGVRALEVLRDLGVETHLVVTKPGELTLDLEMGRSLVDVAPLATEAHACDDLTASIASGSFATAGMVVVPCSIRSLSAIANSYAHNLLARAADVTLKEGRPLVLVVRETPLHLGHLRLMVQAAELGAIIFPPMPAFYALPQSLEDLVDQTVGRVVDRLGFPNCYYRPWTGEA